MSIEIFSIKKNDTKPAIAVTLQYNNGSAVDLTGGSVFFIMGNLSDFSAYTSGAANITDSTTGQVEYRWTGSIDTGSPNTYWAEFEIVWPGGSRMTLPTDNNLQIKVFEDYN